MVQKLLTVLLVVVLGQVSLAEDSSQKTYRPNCQCSDRDDCRLDSDCSACTSGYVGPRCSMKNIALGQNTSQSSEIPGRASDLAINGDRSQSNSSGCTYTDSTQSGSPWWKITLDRIYWVNQVRVWYPHDASVLTGFSISIGYTRDEHWRTCYEHDRPMYSEIIVSCDNNLAGDILMLYTSWTVYKSHFLALCEVEIYECLEYYFGENCKSQCNCIDQHEVCDRFTGFCKTGCNIGYTGSGCQLDGGMNATLRLEEIARKARTDTLTSESASALVSVTAAASKDAALLQPLDVIRISEILHSIVNVGALDIQTGENLGKIVNNVFDANTTVLLQAEQNGTSKRITQALETYTLTANLSTRTKARLSFNNLVIEMWNLEENLTVTGIKALDVDDENHEGVLSATENADPLFNNSVVTIRDESGSKHEDNIDDIDVAIILKHEVVKRETLARSPEKLRLAFIIQRSDVLFQEPLQNKTGYVNSRIISASFNNRTLAKLSLENRVQIIFKPLEESLSDGRSPKCVFWDYHLYDGNGGWSSKGCSAPKLEDGVYVCLCDHLTSFAILFELGDVDPDPTHEHILSTLTLVGLSLSLTGLGITVVSILQFRTLRVDMAQKVFFNLALSLMLSWTFFLVGAVMSLEKVHHEVGCEIVAVCLHYFLLSSFMWMLVEAITQYLRFVKVLGTHIPRFMTKASIACWGLPAITVVVVLAIDHRLYYRGDGTTPPRFCWIDQRASYFAFMLPVGLIMIFNLAVFVRVALELSRRSPALKHRKSSLQESKLRFRVGFACFLLLGLTWVFGYFTIEDARIPFQYVFTILNAFQGFFIFLFFVLREKRLRDKFCGVCRKTSTSTSDPCQRSGTSEHPHTEPTKKTEDIALSNL